MFYFKKIISYFDYYEFGEKSRNCGYGRILVRDEKVTMEVHIRGLGAKENRVCDIRTTNQEEKKLGKITLNRGTGRYNGCFHGNDMNGTGLQIFDITGMRIPIDENRYCETCWEWGQLPEKYAKQQTISEGKKETPENRKIRSSETEQAGEKQGRSPETEQAGEKQGRSPETERAGEKQGRSPETERTAEKSMWNLRARQAGKKEEQNPETEQEAEKKFLFLETEQTKEESSGAAERETANFLNITVKEKDPHRLETEEKEPQEAVFPEAERKEEKEKESDTVLHKTQMGERQINMWPQEEADEIPLQKMLYDDKWKQLCCLYPVCHPFGEEEAYISIAPKDFVILRKEYQNLVSNSFLLHSFYNYHHLILGRAGGQDDEMFYIGVPGAYLEREKRVAVMFGFEGFALSERGNRTRNAAAGEQNGRIENGAFGYYMRKVEI